MSTFRKLVLVAGLGSVLIGCRSTQVTSTQSIVTEDPPVTANETVIRKEETRTVREEAVIGTGAEHPGAGKGAGWVK